MLKPGALALCGLLAFGAMAGPSAAAPPNANAVVVSVGSAKLGVSEVSRRLAKLPGYQLASLGRTPDGIRRGFVEKVLVPELASAQEATRLRLGATPAMREQIRGILNRALEDEVRAQLVRDKSVTEADVRGYFEAN